MSENTIHNTNEKSTINENSEILINILRVLTMLQNALNCLMRKNYFDRSQYPEEYIIIESFIFQMRAWINDYKFLSGTEKFCTIFVRRKKCSQKPI